MPDDQGRTDEDIIRGHFYDYLKDKDMRKALDAAKDLDHHELWSLYNELGTIRDAMINTLMGSVVEEYMRVQEKAQRQQRKRRRRDDAGGQ